MSRCHSVHQLNDTAAAIFPHRSILYSEEAPLQNYTGQL